MGGKVGRRAKLVVAAALAAAVVFGGYLGYLAWSSDSFPVEQRPFQNYAAVQSANFNGTQYAFTLKWLNSSYLPMYAQLYSATDDAADSPVCDLQLSSVNSGQVIYLPFGTSAPAATLSNVELSMAVRPLAGGGDFTIVHSVDRVDAVPGNIVPSNISCSGSGANM